MFPDWTSLIAPLTTDQLLIRRVAAQSTREAIQQIRGFEQDWDTFWHTRVVPEQKLMAKPLGGPLQVVHIKHLKDEVLLIAQPYVLACALCVSGGESSRVHGMRRMGESKRALERVNVQEPMSSLLGLSICICVSLCRVEPTPFLSLPSPPRVHLGRACMATKSVHTRTIMAVAAAVMVQTHNHAPRKSCDFHVN